MHRPSLQARHLQMHPNVNVRIVTSLATELRKCSDYATRVANTFVQLGASSHVVIRSSRRRLTLFVRQKLSIEIQTLWLVLPTVRLNSFVQQP